MWKETYECLWEIFVRDPRAVDRDFIEIRKKFEESRKNTTFKRKTGQLIHFMHTLLGVSQVGHMFRMKERALQKNK